MFVFSKILFTCKSDNPQINNNKLSRRNRRKRTEKIEEEEEEELVDGF